MWQMLLQPLIRKNNNVIIAAVRGGGHNGGGLGTVDDGLVIDLSLMKYKELTERRNCKSREEPHGVMLTMQLRLLEWLYHVE
jgi:hypothetical protein